MQKFLFYEMYTVLNFNKFAMLSWSQEKEILQISLLTAGPQEKSMKLHDMKSTGFFWLSLVSEYFFLFW